MEMHFSTIYCISYREPLLWVVVIPLSSLELLIGFGLARWTTGSGLLRWPLRVFGVLLLTATGIALGIIGVGSLPLLLSGGERQFCTHFVRPALLLPGLFALVGVTWSSARISAAHSHPTSR